MRESESGPNLELTNPMESQNSDRRIRDAENTLTAYAAAVSNLHLFLPLPQHKCVRTR